MPTLSNGRETFSPDAAFYLGPTSARDAGFLAGPPALAVEIRSPDDYGPAAELELALKRADYFEAGTAIVWDVDSETQVVRVYRSTDPETPAEFAVGDVADAEPVMPGWRLAVSEIFAT